jgi:hypothetical protein
VLAHGLIPLRQIILAEAEDRLHRIAEYGGRQGIRGKTDERMLPDRAVLVFVHDQPREACRDNVVDMTRLQ